MSNQVNVKIDFEKQLGKIKPMHAVNNGPYPAAKDQKRGNFNDYRAARIPYARNHDASFDAGYGGNHTVDVNFIFPNFDADVNDPESYDFACTDEYVKNTYLAGTEMFYRLGTRIEHEVKKYNSIMPRDFKKWAEICEHIIMHYTEGWADGFQYKMEYWEIWNEPDLDPDDSLNKRCWSGSTLEFCEFFKVAAKHLKTRFPHLKIGGPASAGDEDWLEKFLKYQSENGVPMDFVSWHWYWTEPLDMSKKGTRVRALMKKYGYGDAESILNEWNYVRGWGGDDWIYSLEVMKNYKGAAFIAATMIMSQREPLDNLMYYDARPGGMNGMFCTDIVSKILKGYYPFYIFNKLYTQKNEVSSESDEADIWVCAASGEEHNTMITYYNDDDNAPSAKEVKVSFCGLDAKDGVRLEYYISDKDNDYRLLREEIFTSDKFASYITMPLNSTYFLRIVKN